MTHADPHERLAHLRGGLQLLGAALDGLTDIAEDMHRAIAAAPLALLAAVPETRPLPRLHDGLRRGIYRSIRGLARRIFAATDAALALAGPALAPPAAIPGPLVGLLHGLVGDAIHRDHNPLCITMHLRHHGCPLPRTRDALARALPRPAHLVIFVHGLACDDSAWEHASLPAWGRPGVSYASLLRDQGLTTLHLRYNSGLPIPSNGRALATLLSDLLADLLAIDPDLAPRLTLIGHSMGGLVVRSACHFGQRAAAPWTHHLRDIICLGSPHDGAPLEQFGALATALLTRIPVTAALGRAIDRRSAGIKDLRRGTVIDDASPDIPLAHARYHFIAGSYGRTHPLARALGWALGDGLVRVTSARHDRARTTAARTTPARTRRLHLGGLHHMHLLNHPRVFAHIDAALARPA